MLLKKQTRPLISCASCPLLRLPHIKIILLVIFIAHFILFTAPSVFAAGGAGHRHPNDLNSLSEADWVAAFKETRKGQAGFRVESVNEFKAITNYYYVRLLDGVEVHRFRLKNGDTIQCILVHTQGALSAAGRAPESVQFAPSIEPVDTSSQGRHAGAIDIGKQFDLDGLLDEDGNTRACAQGSFPRLMPKLENLYHFRKLEDIYQKYPGKATTPGQMLKSAPSVNHEWAHASRMVSNTGSSASFNVWAPYVEQPGEFSLSQLWVVGGTGDNRQTVEAGWQVFKDMYGDNQPHLFIFFTTHNYSSDYPKCYNLDCTGFVQTNPNVVIGGPLSQVSAIGGVQYSVKLMYLRDAGGSHDWWFKFGDEWVGYYPNSLFNSQGIANQSDSIDYGGEIVNEATGGLHTTTQMGSGRFPSEGWQKAAYIKKLKYVDLNNYLHDSTWLTKDTSANGADNSDYYDLALHSSADPEWLQYFYFGGRGRLNNCAAVIFGNLVLDVPIINYNSQYYWADFRYSQGTDFTLTNAGIITDTSSYSNCTPSTLSSDLKLLIPAVMYNGISYWADFQHTDGMTFTLSGAGTN